MHCQSVRYDSFRPYARFSYVSDDFRRWDHSGGRRVQVPLQRAAHAVAVARTCFRCGCRGVPEYLIRL